MNDMPTLDDIRKRHKMLYEKVLRDSSSVTKETAEGKEFLHEVDKLLHDINTLSGKSSSFEDYRWLNDVAIKWQVVFSSILNLPKTIQVSLPGRLLPPQPPPTTLSEDEIEFLLNRYAEYFAFVRILRANKWRSSRERERDHRLAKILFASDVLDGKINFPLRIATICYRHLEEVWLKDVKLLRAYFLWEQRSGGIDPVKEREDYFNVCSHLRAMLVNPGIKADALDFNASRTYLEDRYLNNERLDQTKASTKMLISRKAERIQEITGSRDDLRNWVNAETYVKMFYENIIPAIVDDGYENVLAVLKAFQFSGAEENSWCLINCFETVLATYFLSPETIRKLWDESSKEPIPESSVETVVEVSEWPEFSIPPDCENTCRYDGKTIRFRGIMTESQRDSLLTKISREDHRKQLHQLFKQSRLIHKETTL